MNIDFDDQTNSISDDLLDMLYRLLEHAAEKEGIENKAEVSVTFVDNRAIQEINRTYRQQDKPTDVISFALEEKAEGELAVVGEEIPRVLGDIIISVDRAREQALDYNHSFEREVGFLCVHGFLHLLGYDHMNKADEKKMFGQQEEILNALGLKR